MRHWHDAGIRPTLRCSSLYRLCQYRLFTRSVRLGSERTPTSNAASKPEAADGGDTGHEASATDAVKAAIRKSLGARFAQAFSSDGERDASRSETNKDDLLGNRAVSLADFYKQRNTSSEKPDKQGSSSAENARLPQEPSKQKLRTRKDRLKIKKVPAPLRIRRTTSAPSAVPKGTKQKSTSAADIRWVKSGSDSSKKQSAARRDDSPQPLGNDQRWENEHASETRSASDDVEDTSAPGGEKKLIRPHFSERKEKNPEDMNSRIAGRLRRKERRRLMEAHAKSGPKAQRRAAAGNPSKKSLIGNDTSPESTPQKSAYSEAYKPLSLKDALMGKTLENAIEDDGAQLGFPKSGAKIEITNASDLELTPLPIDQPPVPSLGYGLDRVLFNRGVYQLQDPYSMVYNFDPYLQKIMPVTEFDYHALKEYKTSSQDGLLSGIAREHNKKYVGSTSSMTGSLAHFHYLLSNWRPLTFSMLSREFEKPLETFTEINRAPSAIFLRWKNGTYAIDADKEFDGANVLMLLGKSLEKLLTMNTSDFERYRKSDPREVPEEERENPESFHYSTQGDFLMRSQLDAYDPRLPGTGMFDLKTRAVVSIRMQSDDYEEMSGYELHRQFGRFESYEREYYDMIRSTMLKYSLQARMGRMDGIFVAYHNVKRIFGFQYLNMSEMDRALHGQEDRCLGNQEFKLSIELLNQILNKATEKFPEQSIRFHFETRASHVIPFMYAFAEPMSEDEIDKIQNSQKEKVAEYERSIMGMAPKEEDPGNYTEAASVVEPDLATETAAETATSDAESTKKPSEEVTKPSSAPREFSVEVMQTASDQPIENANPQQPQSASPFGTSESSADREFLSSLKKKSREEEESYKPLLAMTLTVRSRVNGSYVERPERLKPDDDWQAEYALAEIPKMSRAWALYEATKARRKKVFDRVRGDKKEGENEESKQAKFSNDYIEMLRELARKGRRLRDNIDLVELDREKVVFGEPYGKAEKRPEQADPEINGVDDYLRALWSEKRSG